MSLSIAHSADGFAPHPWQAARAGLLVILAIGVMCSAVSCPAWREDDAKQRVTTVLSGLQAAGGDSRNVSTQTAVCEWARGVTVIADDADMSIASNHFTSWANEKGIYKKISSFEITGAQSANGEYGPEVIVSVTVEGTPLKIRVLKNAPLTWVD